MVKRCCTNMQRCSSCPISPSASSSTSSRSTRPRPGRKRRQRLASVRRRSRRALRNSNADSVSPCSIVKRGNASFVRRRCRWSRTHDRCWASPPTSPAGPIGCNRAAPGRVRLGMIDAAAVVHFPDHLQAFRAAHPDIELLIRVAPSATLLKLLEAGHLQSGGLRDAATSAPGGHRPCAQDRGALGVRPARSTHRCAGELGPLGAVSGRLAHPRCRRRGTTSPRRAARRRRRESPAGSPPRDGAPRCGMVGAAERAGRGRAARARTGAADCDPSAGNRHACECGAGSGRGAARAATASQQPGPHATASLTRGSACRTILRCLSASSVQAPLSLRSCWWWVARVRSSRNRSRRPRQQPPPVTEPATPGVPAVDAAPQDRLVRRVPDEQFVELRFSNRYILTFRADIVPRDPRRACRRRHSRPDPHGRQQRDRTGVVTPPVRRRP